MLALGCSALESVRELAIRGRIRHFGLPYFLVNHKSFFGEFRNVVISCRKGTFSIVPVVILSITKAIHLQNVVRRANRCPLPAHLLNTTQKKLSEASRPFDLSGDGFPQCSFALHKRPRPPSSGACASFSIHPPRGALRKWSAFAGLRLITGRVCSQSFFQILKSTFPITHRRLFLAVLSA